MLQALLDSLATVPHFLLYAALATGLSVVFVWLYSAITPYSERKLIQDGNLAAALSLSGSLLGFALALSSAIAHSVDVLDLLVWGALALGIQLMAYGVCRAFLPTLVQGIENNIVAHGVFVAAVSLAAGLLNAACMTY